MGGPEIRTEISGSTGSRGEAWADHPNVGGLVINPTDNATESAHSFQLNEFLFSPDSAHRATERRPRPVGRSEGRQQQREEASAAAMWGVRVWAVEGRRDGMDGSGGWWWFREGQMEEAV